MSDSALENAIRERKELQEKIRIALERLGEIEKFLQMHRRFALNSSTKDEHPTGDTLGRAGVGMAQPIFEMLATSVLRDVGRPLQSGEIVEEFKKRGHPIGGLNEVKQAWNRLWEAKTRNVLVNLPPLGYWLADEPLPENVEVPDDFKRKRVGNPRRHIRAPRGRKRTLTPETLEKAKAMLLSGKTVKQVADELGGISSQALYHYFPGGIRGLKTADESKE